MDIYNITIINIINWVIINRKTSTFPFNPVFFFILSSVKPFEILPKHNGYSLISESVNCYVMRNLFTFGSLQFCNNSTIFFTES